MCTACVAQGVFYVGGAVAGLRVWSARRQRAASAPAAGAGGRAAVSVNDGAAAPLDGDVPPGEAAGYRLASLSGHVPTTTDRGSGWARKPSDA